MAGSVKVDVLFDANNVLKGAITALASAFAVSKIVDYANAQEDAINRLNSQLKLTGDFSEETSREMQQFASELQKVTVVGDELTLANLALAKSFNATNDQAIQIAKSAADLSASMGISLESATRNISKTLGGLSGELGEIIPELKELGAEALKAGAGIDFIANRFAGAAKEQANTFSGRMKQLTNEIGDLFEEVGAIITKNPILKGFISDTKDGVGDLISLLKRNQKDIFTFSKNAVSIILWMADGFLSAFGLISKGISLLIKPFKITFEFIDEWIIGLVRKINKFFGEFLKDAVKFAQKIGVISKGLELFSTVLIDSFVGGKGANKAVETVIGSLEKLELEQSELRKKFEKGSLALLEYNEQIEKLELNTEKTGKKIKGLGNAIKDTAGENGFINLSGKIDLVGLGKSFISGVMEGSSGTRKVLGKLAGIIGKAVSKVPIVGELFEEIFNLFSMTPEQFKKMITGFIEAIPEIIFNLAENLLTAFEPIMEGIVNGLVKFIERLPSIVPALIKFFILRVPLIILAFIKGIPLIIAAIVGAVPEIITAFVTTMISEAPRIAEALIKAVLKLPGNISQSVGGGALGGALIGGGIGFALGGPLGAGLGAAIGGGLFAEGGMVPEGFPHDKFPARLTSGEYVIDRDTTKDLQQFLRGQGGGREVINAEIKINERVFGDIILELNRSGARLT